MNIIQIKAFQKKYGLVVDGIIGPQTRKVIAAIKNGASKYAKPEPDKSAMSLPIPASVPQSVLPEFKNKIVIASTSRPIDEIIVHCTATPEARRFDVKDVNAWHVARGWSMIGYHYLVLLDGAIQVGRPIGMAGAHVAGHNNGTIGISYVGGVDKYGKTPKDTRTSGQKAALIWLCGALAKKYNITKPIRGHNYYDKGKACPSFDVAKDYLGNMLGIRPAAIVPKMSALTVSPEMIRADELHENKPKGIMKMMNEKIWGLVRTVLASGLTWAAAKGYVDALVIPELAAAITTMAVAVWSWTSKNK